MMLMMITTHPPNSHSLHVSSRSPIPAAVVFMALPVCHCESHSQAHGGGRYLFALSVAANKHTNVITSIQYVLLYFLSPTHNGSGEHQWTQ